MEDPLLTDDARRLVADLTVRGQSVATAESLTAGLLAATLAGVAGASVVLRAATWGVGLAGVAGGEAGQSGRSWAESRRVGTNGRAAGVYLMNC